MALMVYLLAGSLLLYVILLLLLMRGWRMIYTKQRVHGPDVFISVIVACRDEEAVIADLLRDLHEQDYPSFEVLLIDDHSSDKTVTQAQYVMKGNPMYHTLYIRDLSLMVHLGCEADERKLQQEVKVNLEFRFASAPKAIVTDDIQDTICYAKVSHDLKKYCTGKEFKLIEKMAEDLIHVARERVPPSTQVGLIIHKVNPPIKEIKGGTAYRIADFL